MGVEDTDAPHMWVAVSYMPIEVEPQADGSLSTYMREGAEEAAQEDASFVCWHCMIELTTESYTTPCPAAKQGS